MNRVPSQRFWVLVGSLWAVLALAAIIIVGILYPPGSVGASRMQTGRVDPAASTLWQSVERRLAAQEAIFFPAYAPMLEVELAGSTLSARLTALPSADEDLFFLAAEIFPAVASAAQLSGGGQLERVELSGVQRSGSEVVFYLEGAEAIRALARGEQDVYQLMRGENR